MLASLQLKNAKVLVEKISFNVAEQGRVQKFEMGGTAIFDVQFTARNQVKTKKKRPSRPQLMFQRGGARSQRPSPPGYAPAEIV